MTVLFYFDKRIIKSKHKFLSKAFISVTYCWDILQFNFKKSLDLDLNNLGLTLWYIGLGLKKYLSYLNGLGLILWYIEVRLEKYSDYLTGFELILW